VLEAIGSAAEKAAKPALMGTAAAAAIGGGMALRSRSHNRSRTPGLPSMPFNRGTFKSVVEEVEGVGRQIGKSGFQVGVGDVTMELRRDRSRSAKSERQSPLEVLLHGLTSRREK
jgi:hypothetical protein